MGLYALCFRYDYDPDKCVLSPSVNQSPNLSIFIFHERELISWFGNHSPRSTGIVYPGVSYCDEFLEQIKQTTDYAQVMECLNLMQDPESIEAPGLKRYISERAGKPVLRLAINPGSRKDIIDLMRAHSGYFTEELRNAERICLENVNADGSLYRMFHHIDDILYI